jgi:uncharacterized protein (TIGR02145 family)
MNSKAKIVFLLTSLMFFFGSVYCQTENKKKSKEVKTVKISNQVWMSKNLDENKFRNGDLIPEAKTDAEWQKAGENKQPAWCYYNNKAANGTRYGKLYNWYAVTDPRGLAPMGWHIPSDAEWTTLTDYLGGEAVAGPKIKSKSGWIEKGNGNNESGFSGFPGGYRNSSGNFNFIAVYGKWWTTTESESRKAWFRDLNYQHRDVFRDNIRKDYGLSVRCLMD